MPILGAYERSMEAEYGRQPHTPIFIAAIFPPARKRNHLSKCMGRGWRNDLIMKSSCCSYRVPSTHTVAHKYL